MGGPAYGHPLTVSRMAQQIAEQTGKEPTTDWLWKRQFDELERTRKAIEEESRLHLILMVVAFLVLVALITYSYMEEL